MKRITYLLLFVLTTQLALAAFRIPVVFFIIDDGQGNPVTDQIVQEQLDEMNNHYAATGIVFCLARELNSQPLALPDVVTIPHQYTQGSGGAVDFYYATSNMPGIYHVDASVTLSGGGLGTLNPTTDHQAADWINLSNLSPLSNDKFSQNFCP